MSTSIQKTQKRLHQTTTLQQKSNRGRSISKGNPTRHSSRRINHRTRSRVRSSTRRLQPGEHVHRTMLRHSTWYVPAAEMFRPCCCGAAVCSVFFLSFFLFLSLFCSFSRSFFRLVCWRKAPTHASGFAIGGVKKQEEVGRGVRPCAYAQTRAGGCARSNHCPLKGQQRPTPAAVAVAAAAIVAGTRSSSRVSEPTVTDTASAGVEHATMQIFVKTLTGKTITCLLYTSPSPRDRG